MAVTILQIDRFLEHSKTTHAMGRPGTVQEVFTFKTNKFQKKKTKKKQFCVGFLSRWPTQWPSWQAREPPSSPGKPSLLTEAGVLCVLDRREKYN